MRMPDIYRLKSFYRFIAGVCIGIIIGWTFFLFQYGQVYEDLMVKVYKYKTENERLEKDIDILINEQRMENDENQKKLTVQQIEIIFSNERNTRLNRLNLFDLERQALNELEYAKRKEINVVSEMLDLIENTLENKIFLIEERQYQLIVEQSRLYTTLILKVKIVPL